MVRDRVGRDTRFRDDAFAVALRDSSVILVPFGLTTALTHARRYGAALVLRLKVDALRFVAAMIYAGVNIQFRKPRLDLIRPTLAPFLDQLGAVTVSFLRAKTLFVHRWQCGHDMGIGLLYPLPAPAH